MNDSLARLLEYIEPKISNIPNDRVEVKTLKDVYETIKEIVELGDNSYLNILDFYDQDFIIKTIKIGPDNIKNTIDNYESSKYLLKSPNQDLKELPQYKQAILYMETLFKYLYNLYKEISLE